jgi:hypothetical protein
VALKIIPFREDISVLNNNPSTTLMADLYQEIAITRLLCDGRASIGMIPSHFIIAEELVSHVLSMMGTPYHIVHVSFLRRIGICRGRYPEVLLKEWDLWKADNISENRRPGILMATTQSTSHLEPLCLSLTYFEDIFDENQLFAVFILENGGRDLEHVELQDIEQIKAILFQTIASLHWAEVNYNFEHRDLHMGNMLLKSLDSTMANTSEYILKRRHRGFERFVLRNHGTKMVIIDYTLSRLETSKNHDIVLI